jgi:hypothetical protein
MYCSDHMLQANALYAKYKAANAVALDTFADDALDQAIALRQEYARRFLDYEDTGAHRAYIGILQRVRALDLKNAASYSVLAASAASVAPCAASVAASAASSVASCAASSVAASAASVAASAASSSAASAASVAPCAASSSAASSVAASAASSVASCAAYRRTAYNRWMTYSAYFSDFKRIVGLRSVAVGNL